MIFARTFCSFTKRKSGKQACRFFSCSKHFKKQDQGILDLDNRCGGVNEGAGQKKNKSAGKDGKGLLRKAGKDQLIKKKPHEIAKRIGDKINTRKAADHGVAL